MAEYNIVPGWRLETGAGGFGEKGCRWVCVRHLESQRGQDFYEDRDMLAFNFLRALADTYEARASLKNTPPLTPELEAALRCTISPVYAGVRGTESYERTVFFGEIDRLRAEVTELAQQRGDLARRVLELEEAERLLYRLHLATGFVPQGDLSDGEFACIRGARMQAGYYLRQRAAASRTVNVESDSQPSEMPK